MSKMPSIFMLVVTGLAVLITLNGLLRLSNPSSLFFNLLFMPITLYLVLGSALHITSRTPVFGPRNAFVKLLTFYCLVITSTLVIAGFMSSRSAPDFISSMVFAPLAVFFLMSVWPHANVAPLNPSNQRQYSSPMINIKTGGKFDVNRRDFLKLIGTAGISIFLYNLIFRRDGAPLFGSSGAASPLTLKNALGQVINPAEKSPTQGYSISQIDDGAIGYFGFVNNVGQWYVMRQDVDDSYRYVKGDKDFTSAWANRTQLTYDYFDNVF